MLSLNFVFLAEAQVYFVIVGIILVVAVFSFFLISKIKREKRKKRDEKITRELLEMNEKRKQEKHHILSEIAKNLKVDKDSLILERVKKNQNFISSSEGASYFYAYCNNEAYLIEFSNEKVSKVTQKAFFD